jgi:pyridoxal phosphate enzyme (YggS family)
MELSTNSDDTLTINHRIGQMRLEIADFARRLGRDPQTIRLMAVTKTQPWAAIQAAVDCGLELIGENRVQEIMAKLPSVWPYQSAELHFIGHLQKNKIKKLLPYISAIQSIDHPDTLRLVDREAGLLAKTITIFLEVNTSGETAKSGVTVLSDLIELAIAAAKAPNLRLCGLMTVGPLGNDQSKIKLAFEQLAAWRTVVQSQPGCRTCSELSMGMSADWRLAVAAGSTMLRIGSALFGNRV